MVLVTRARLGPLLAGTLGVVIVGSSFSPMVLGAAASGIVKDEVVVTAGREQDAVIAAKVTAAVQEDPYIFSDHVTVTVENGVVRLEGVVSDLPDLFRILRLARRVAGRGRVVNEIEYDPAESDAP